MMQLRHRSGAIVVCLVMLVLASGVTFARPRPAPRPSWIARDGVELNELLRERIGAVAAIYFKKTRRTLEITSGYRAPARQAAAMYGKLAVGGSLAIYKNQALVDPLRRAFRDGRKKRWKKERIIAAMAEILEAQVGRGIYLSRHMRGRAFDVRSNGMSAGQRAAFRDAVAAVGDMRVIYESKPPHFHVEIFVKGVPGDNEGDNEGDHEGANDVEDEDDAPVPASEPDAEPAPGPENAVEP